MRPFTNQIAFVPWKRAGALADTEDDHFLVMPFCVPHALGCTSCFLHAALTRQPFITFNYTAYLNALAQKPMCWCKCALVTFYCLSTYSVLHTKLPTALIKGKAISDSGEQRQSPFLPRKHGAETDSTFLEKRWRMSHRQTRGSQQNAGLQCSIPSG